VFFKVVLEHIVENIKDKLIFFKDPRLHMLLSIKNLYDSMIKKVNIYINNIFLQKKVINLFFKNILILN